MRSFSTQALNSAIEKEQNEIMHCLRYNDVFEIRNHLSKGFTSISKKVEPLMNRLMQTWSVKLPTFETFSTAYIKYP